MTPKYQRLWLVFSGLLGLGLISAVMLNVFSDNLLFYYSPSDIKAKQIDTDQPIRIGGLVKQGTILKQTKNSIPHVQFVLTDLSHEITIHYQGLLPSLFREGQGMIARGTLQADGSFKAEELLAKHDENYMPPEVATSLSKQKIPAKGY